MGKRGGPAYYCYITYTFSVVLLLPALISTITYLLLLCHWDVSLNPFSHLTFTSADSEQ